MGRITTVIFDMYETLVKNHQDSWKDGFEAIIREQALDTNADRLWQEWSAADSEFRASRVRPEVPFRTYYEAWRDCFVHAFTILGIPGDPGCATSSFISFISRRNPYPETVEAVRAVQDRWRTAVLSNADDDYLMPNLDLLGLEFEAVLSSEEARVYKPLPGLFRQMLRRLNVTPGESVYVGDRQYEDVQGASEVGINAVWINRSGTPPDPNLPEPAYQIHSLLELPGLLSAWPPAADGAR
jgi:2-haloacid dehalogenase